MAAECLEIEIAEAFVPLLSPKRIKSYYGGRGSAKSHEFAEILVMEATRGTPILCAREFQNSIEDSVYSLIKEKITKLGLDDEFDIQATAIFHRRSGGLFRFMGFARNIESMKSKFGYKICWIEEGETVSQKTWDVLIPTIRAEGSEIWVSWNPNEAISPTYQLLVAPYIEQIRAHGFYEDDYIYCRKVTFKDNPWFPEVLRVEMERDKAKNFKKYLHVWMGECYGDYEDSVIESDWLDAAVDAHLALNVKPMGERVVGFDPADAGSDAKALTCRYGLLIEEVTQWTHGGIDLAVSMAFDKAFEYRADILVYDQIGVGAGVKVGLTERIAGRNIKVSGFDAGAAPVPGIYKNDKPNCDVFRNRRAQYWWLLRDRFERTYEAINNGAYHDPSTLISLSSNIKDLDLLKAELVRQQRKRTSGSTLIQLVSKDEMRLKKIASPNMADSLMQSFAIDTLPKTVPGASVSIPQRVHYHR